MNHWVIEHEEVLKLADRALYVAKESGRNCTVGLIPTSTDAAYRPTIAEDAGAQTPKSDRVVVHTLRTAGPNTPDRRADSENDLPSSGDSVVKASATDLEP